MVKWYVSPSIEVTKSCPLLTISSTILFKDPVIIALSILSKISAFSFPVLFEAIPDTISSNNCCSLVLFPGKVWFEHLYLSSTFNSNFDNASLLLLVFVFDPGQSHVTFFVAVS